MCVPDRSDGYKVLLVVMEVVSSNPGRHMSVSKKDVIFEFAGLKVWLSDVVGLVNH